MRQWHYSGFTTGCLFLLSFGTSEWDFLSLFISAKMERWSHLLIVWEEIKNNIATVLLNNLVFTIYISVLPINSHSQLSFTFPVDLPHSNNSASSKIWLEWTIFFPQLILIVCNLEARYDLARHWYPSTFFSFHLATGELFSDWVSGFN